MYRPEHSVLAAEFYSELTQLRNKKTHLLRHLESAQFHVKVDKASNVNRFQVIVSVIPSQHFNKYVYPLFDYAFNNPVSISVRVKCSLLIRSLFTEAANNSVYPASND
jgi:hypothetical protein